MAGIPAAVLSCNDQEFGLTGALKLSPIEVCHLKECSPTVMKFLMELKDYVSPTGTSLCVVKQHEKVNDRLLRARISCLENRIIYEELQRILEESSSEAKPVQIEKLADIKRFVTSTEVMQKLNKMQYSGHLQLRNEDFLFVTDFKEDTQVLKTLLENRLQEKLQTFEKHYHLLTATHDDKDEMNKFSTGLELPSIINSHVEKMKQMKLELSASLDENLILHRKHWEVLKRLGKVLSETANLLITYDLDVSNLGFLKIYLDVAMLKTREFTLNVQRKTYTEDVVKAHQQISYHLQHAIGVAINQKKKSEQQLVLYNALGPEYNALLTTYSKTLSDIKEHEWVLKKLAEKTKTS